MEKVRYFFGVLLVVFLPPGMLWWFLVHPFVDFWRKRGATVTLIAMAAIGIAGGLALWRIRDALLLTDYGTHTSLIVLAAALFTVSAAISKSRRKQLTIRVLAGSPEVGQGGTGGELLNEGLYSMIRHPRYVEIAIGAMAYAVFANYLGGYIVAALTVPALHLIVILEERELIDRFGEEYLKYMKEVPRYIPHRRGSA